jgi:hypothetical protein
MMIINVEHARLKPTKNSKNLKRAHSEEIAKIETQIDDSKKQIANLAYGV